MNNLPFKYIIIMMFLFTRISLKSVWQKHRDIVLKDYTLHIKQVYCCRCCCCWCLLLLMMLSVYLTDLLTSWLVRIKRTVFPQNGQKQFVCFIWKRLLHLLSHYKSLFNFLFTCFLIVRERLSRIALQKSSLRE